MAVGVSVSGEMPLHSGMANAGWVTKIAVEAGAGNLTNMLWDVITPVQVHRVQLLVTDALDYDTQTAEAVVSFFKRVTYGSDVGRVLIGRVRLPHGTPAGVRLYADVDPVVCLPGEQIIAAITTAGTGGGGIAGDFQPEVIVTPVPEMPTNAISPAGVAMMVPAAP